MPASRTQKLADLLDRWKFAGAVLLMEAMRIHEVRGCCQLATDPPTYCMGANALVQSVGKLTREAEDILHAPTRSRRPKS